MKKILSLLLCLFGLIGCTNTKEKEYIGTYIFGHEIEIFEDKETGYSYWLYGNVEGINNYSLKLIQNGKDSYPEVKMRIKGIDKGKAKNELAEPEDRVMEVREYEILK